MESLANAKTKRIPSNRRSSLAAPKDSVSDIERGFADDEYSGDESVAASVIKLDEEDHVSDVPTLVASTPTVSQHSIPSSEYESSASASSTTSSNEHIANKAEQSSSESSPSTNDWDADLSSEECSE